MTNTPELWYAPTVYRKCITDGPNRATLIELTIPYNAWDCDDFDAVQNGQPRAWLAIYNIWGTCDGTVMLGSEKVLDMVAVGDGTTACPINFDMEQWDVWWSPGPPGQIVKGPITVRATVTG